MKLTLVFIAAASLLAASVSVNAQSNVQMRRHNQQRDVLLDEYRAYIGSDDLYNSNGRRLDAPWQVLRQDRANVHAYNIRQRGDQTDNFFGSRRNRDQFEEMLASGRISPQASRRIMRGDIFVNVQIWRGNRGGDYVLVEVD